MTGRVKKSLFAMLRPTLPGACVVDLYAGTGTLGLEAISNGARRCAFAERDRQALNRLQRNINEIGLADRCEVWAGNLEANLPAWLEELSERVDVAFCDPPYPAVRKWNWTDIEQRLFRPLGEYLADHGQVVLRLPGDRQAPDQLGPLQCRRTKTYGEMTLQFYARQ
jgi:16S rRNA (guanine(966)-N(2))-methyltransferase RsmD